MTSANLLIVVLGGHSCRRAYGFGAWWPAHAVSRGPSAGFLGTIIAGIVRNTIMVRSGQSSDDLRVPMLVLIDPAVASLAGSAAADEVSRLSEVSSPVWLGTLAVLSGRSVRDVDDYLSHEPGDPSSQEIGRQDKAQQVLVLAGSFSRAQFWFSGRRRLGPSSGNRTGTVPNRGH